MARKNPRPNAVVLQSGGPTVVINRSLYGVIDQWRKKSPTAKIFGSIFGVRGLLTGNTVDLKNHSSISLFDISNTPSAALGSSRINLCDRGELDTELLEKIFCELEKLNAGYVFVIGGEDSRENAIAISRYAKKKKIKITIIHIPKTIDNDLTGTHHSPGYGSAAKFVALSCIGLDCENAAMGGVMIDVVMGRHTGWLAAAGSLSRSHLKKSGMRNPGPHLIYVPEGKFSVAGLLRDTERVYSEFKRAHIVISEGIAESPEVQQYFENFGGKTLLGPLCQKDAFNHVQLSGTGIFGAVLCRIIKDAFPELKVRANTFEYLQRSFPMVSASDGIQAENAGREAVSWARKGITDAMITVGKPSFSYNCGIEFVLFDELQGGLKELPQSLLPNEGIINSSSMLEYSGPLIIDKEAKIPLPFFRTYGNFL